MFLATSPTYCRAKNTASANSIWSYVTDPVRFTRHMLRGTKTLTDEEFASLAKRGQLTGIFCQNLLTTAVSPSLDYFTFNGTALSWLFPLNPGAYYCTADSTGSETLTFTGLPGATAGTYRFLRTGRTFAPTFPFINGTLQGITITNDGSATGTVDMWLVGFIVSEIDHCTFMTQINPHDSNSAVVTLFGYPETAADVEERWLGHFDAATSKYTESYLSGWGLDSKADLRAASLGAAQAWRGAFWDIPTYGHTIGGLSWFDAGEGSPGFAVFGRSFDLGTSSTSGNPIAYSNGYTEPLVLTQLPTDQFVAPEFWPRRAADYYAMIPGAKTALTRPTSATAVVPGPAGLTTPLIFNGDLALARQAVEVPEMLESAVEDTTAQTLGVRTLPPAVEGDPAQVTYSQLKHGTGRTHAPNEKVMTGFQPLHPLGLPGDVVSQRGSLIRASRAFVGTFSGYSEGKPSASVTE